MNTINKIRNALIMPFLLLASNIALFANEPIKDIFDTSFTVLQSGKRMFEDTSIGFEFSMGTPLGISTIYKSNTYILYNGSTLLYFTKPVSPNIGFKFGVGGINTCSKLDCCFEVNKKNINTKPLVVKQVGVAVSSGTYFNVWDLWNVNVLVELPIYSKGSYASSSEKIPFSTSLFDKNEFTSHLSPAKGSLSLSSTWLKIRQVEIEVHFGLYYTPGFSMANSAILSNSINSEKVPLNTEISRDGTIGGFFTVSGNFLQNL